jgi:CBS domain containing-hemolysin-like protein
MEYHYLGAALLALLFLALFSGLEIAFVSTNRLHIELQSKLGTFNGRILAGLIKNPGQFTGTALIGNTISLVLFGVFITYFFEPVLVNFLPEGLDNQNTTILLLIVFSSLVVLIVAEYVPKSLFRLNPATLLTYLTVPFLLLYYLMYPVVWLIGGLSRALVTKVLNLEYPVDKPVFSITDLNSFIQTNLQTKGEESNVDIDTEIFDNAVEFKTIRIRDCMVPRTEIVGVELEDTIAELRKVFIESGHSKIIIYKENIDEVVGYCHHLELFKKPKSIQDILTPIIIVTESALANELLVQFISERKSLALVVDEFGGTGGIVSMEDIIEQIFGEIEDEYDNDDLIEQQISEQEFLLSSRLEIEYLNEKYNWSLPIGDYETLAGFILSLTENIPKKGQAIVYGDFTFTVVTKQEYRIDTVKIKINSSSL